MSDLESEQLISTEATPFELTVKPARGSPSRLKLSPASRSGARIRLRRLVQPRGVGCGRFYLGTLGALAMPHCFRRACPKRRARRQLRAALPVRVYPPRRDGAVSFRRAAAWLRRPASRGDVAELGRALGRSVPRARHRHPPLSTASPRAASTKCAPAAPVHGRCSARMTPTVCVPGSPNSPMPMTGGSP